MARQWRKRLVRQIRLYWVGLGAILAGAVIMCVGGYRVARSPEFLASYRIHFVDAVYRGQHVGADEQAYYRQEITRLRDGCKLAVVGFGLLMGGVVVARYFQKAPAIVRRARKLPSFYQGVANREPGQQGRN